tara:strand:+ start:1057 stop:2766 length:1710 start_codon:yes stop_codon:yes gene_type:complete
MNQKLSSKNDRRINDRRKEEKLRFSQDEHLNSLLAGVVENVSEYADLLLSKIKALSDIGKALSGEPEINTLLRKIVYEARNFTNADAGTLYTMDNNKLKFKIIQNDTLNIKMGGNAEDEIPFPPVELKETNVSAFVAINAKSVNIEDVYSSDLFDFTGPKKFDESSGYRTKSMLVVPLLNHEDDVIGVLQLINATNPKSGEVIPFNEDNQFLTESLASQAAVAITNVNLIKSMEELFEAFVEVMATAIDEKSPVTGGHIKRVANMTMTFAEMLNQIENGPFENIQYSPDELYELKIAALMHDIGKVTTPVDIVEKGKKLQTIFNRIEHVDLRFLYFIEQKENECLQARIKLIKEKASEKDIQISDQIFQKEINDLKEMRNFLLKCNEPGEFLEDEKIGRIKEISNMTYRDHEGTVKPYLTVEELENLSIRKGSITEKERKIMQNHAAVTLRMLEKIPFTKKLKNIPNFAGAHHEFVNGKGYPLGLKGDEIPFSGRLMAVTDIAEALTASDRPYKKAMPLAVVHKILKAMVSDGELDKNLVEFFIENDVYGKYKEIHENSGGKSPVKIDT